MEKTYKHLAYYIVALFVIIIAGFYKTYFGLFPQFDAGTTPLVHIHLLLLLSWIILLIVQPILIRKRKYETHRILGKASYVLVPLIVLSMIGMMLKEYDEGVQQKLLLSTNLEEIFISFAEMTLFIMFYTLAIIHRRNIPYHMRYMIGTAFGMISPGLARLCVEITGNELVSVVISFIATDTPLIYFIYIEKKKSRKYQPYVVMLISFIIYQSIFLFFYFTNIQYHS